MSELRPLTPEERKTARDPDAWTSAPRPSVLRHGGYIRTVEDVPLPEDDLSTHPIGCTCIFCIPGA